MKCVIVSSNRWNSAITEYALSLAKALSMRKIHVSLILLAHSPAIKRAREDGLFAYELPSFGLIARGKMQDIICLERPTHIILCGGAEEALVATLQGGFQRIRFRGQDFKDWGPVRSFLSRFQSKRLTALLYPSEYLLKKGEIFFPNLKSKAVVLGVETTKFLPLLENSEKNDLVIFGRLDPVKGHQAFIQIYAEAKRLAIHENFPALHIVGEPANVSIADIKHWVNEAGLAFGTDVRVTSHRLKDPKQLMNAALIGVVSSLGSELICRVAEEFLLCGTPVFVSGAGSLDEVLFSGAGWSYFDMDSSAAAAKLRQVVSQARLESLDDRIMRANKAKACFSLESMGAHAEDFLRSLG